MREAIDEPGRTAALVTLDRGLAARVGAHLLRWDVAADDSAGQSLAATPVGVLIQAVAVLAVERFAPAALLSVLKHPLVKVGDGRLPWLEGVRTLDLALRRPASRAGACRTCGLAGGRQFPSTARACAGLVWWHDQAAHFEALETVFERARGTTRADLGALLAAIEGVFTSFSGDAIWSGPAGRAAADLFAQLAATHAHGPHDVVVEDVPAILRQLLGGVTIRPPQGGHPRIAILGLIEARLQQADLLILGGLNEGSWPQASTADPWLSPRVRSELGLADPERRVGLAAHDLATALGARDVLLTRAIRDARSATIASRFLLRIEAMTGGLTEDMRLPALARMIDATEDPAIPAPRPAPCPPVEARPRRISVTEVDRLKADPYAFYARAMLRLQPLDAVDAEPGPAWRGSAVHEVLDAWMRQDALAPDALLPRIAAMLDGAETHPIMRLLWQPRLVEAIEWIAAKIAANRDEQRTALISEVRGTVTIAGVELTGIADRLDTLSDGRLAVIDYKTGKAPSGKAVAAGYSMQLGLLAAIAERAGFEGVAGKVGEFEYWSLAKNGDSFGKVTSPGRAQRPDRKRGLRCPRRGDLYRSCGSLADR